MYSLVPSLRGQVFNGKNNCNAINNNAHASINAKINCNIDIPIHCSFDVTYEINDTYYKLCSATN